MDKINEQMYQANIELVDKNKLLEEDKKILTKRMNRALNFIVENELERKYRYARNLKAILEGRYIESE